MLISNNLISSMLDYFPCLASEYDNSFDSTEKGLMHVIFGQLFKPFVISIFTNPSSTEKAKKDIAMFMELMASSPDSAVKAVLTDTLIEELLDNAQVYSTLEPYLGDKAFFCSNRIKKALGCTE